MDGSGVLIDIVWSDRKLEKSCFTEGAGKKSFGAARWKLLKRRLFALAAAPTLADMHGIGGFHALHADFAGSYSLSLDGPYRLVVRPGNEPVALRRDGGIDESAVTAVIIEEIVDYHG